MAQRVQVSTGIRDRQVYQTLAKIDKSLADAGRIIKRAEGSTSFADATASPGAPTLIETITINTGYVPIEEEELLIRSANFFNLSGATFTGSLGVNSFIAKNAAGEIIIVAELWTADNYSFTSLTADWVLLDIKP